MPVKRGTALPLTVKIVLGLLLGLTCGIVLSEIGGDLDDRIIALAQPIGKAWLGGLQMPLIPLIFGLLVIGVGQAATTARTSGMAGRGILSFAVLLLASATVAAIAGPLILHLWPVPAGATGLLSGAGPISDVPDVRPSADWLLGFIPVNPIRSAADGQVVAIVLFALVFAFAVTRSLPACFRRWSTPCWSSSTGCCGSRRWAFSRLRWSQARDRASRRRAPCSTMCASLSRSACW